MNYLDIILAIPLLWLTYKGFTKGLIIELSSLLALVLGIYVSIHFSDVAAGFLTQWFSIDPAYQGVIAFATTFIIVVIIINLLGHLLAKLADMVALGFLNKITGAIFGLLKGALLLSIILFIINKFDTSHRFITNDKRESSYLFKPVESLAPALFEIISLDADSLLQQGEEQAQEKLV